MNSMTWGLEWCDTDKELFTSFFSVAPCAMLFVHRCHKFLHQHHVWWEFSSLHCVQNMQLYAKKWPCLIWFEHLRLHLFQGVTGRCRHDRCDWHNAVVLRKINQLRFINKESRQVALKEKIGENSFTGTNFTLEGVITQFTTVTVFKGRITVSCSITDIHVHCNPELFYLT